MPKQKIRTAPFIITLTGSSSCGKSYITDRILDFGETLRENGIMFVPKKHWKYVTRPYRDTEILEKNILQKHIDVKSVKAIPEDCEFVYKTYGDVYGFKKSDLEKYLQNGESPIVVVNDVRVVEELKKEFPNQVLSLFIFREIIQKLEIHEKTGKERGGVSDSKILSRFEKAVALYRVFIENIHIFDRVILNVPYGEASSDKYQFEDIAKIQAEGVIRGVIERKILLNKKITKSPKLFIISGNAQSGKDDIIRAAHKLGKLQADILIKYTNRWEEKEDDGEIYCKYIPKKSLLRKFEKEYNAEKIEFQKQYTFRKFLLNEKSKLLSEFQKKKELFIDEPTFFKVKYEARVLDRLNQIPTAKERFWLNLKKLTAAEEKRFEGAVVNGQLSESVYRSVLKQCFILNPDYVDLDKIRTENRITYTRETKKIKQLVKSKKENNSACVIYNSSPFVLYENNKEIYGKPLFYGFELAKYIKQLVSTNKHLVLTASLPNIFNICRKHFGHKNVITVYTYSQISEEEHIKQNDSVTGAAKLQEYNDILRYAYHIADFDYSVIFAETSSANTGGNQKDELTDQMFRLFRVYNSDKYKHSNKLFVLAGPSATGKSTILAKIIEANLCQIAPKYSSRKKRDTRFDDIISVSKRYISENCKEINYEMYGNTYGFNVKDIKNALTHSNLITICSDIESIKKMKTHFNNEFCTIFIYLKEVSVEHLIKAFFERKNLGINTTEYMEMASKLKEYLNQKNLKLLKTTEQEFFFKLKQHLTNKDIRELKSRYLSLIDNSVFYNKNKDLMDHVITGSSLKSLLLSCKKIIKDKIKT